MEMTEENIQKIREHVEFLSGLTDDDWRQLGVTVNKVSYYLKELGVPSNIKGYKYLITAIELVMKNQEEYSRVTKVLYPAIAKRYSTTPSRVERAIRHAIDKAFSRGNMEIIDKIFVNTYSSEKGKTTNSEFIFGLAEYIKS